MKYRNYIVKGILGTGFVAGVGGVIWWLLTVQPAGAVKPAPLPPPADVARPLKEEQVNTITLTPQAVERLALRTAPVESKAMPRTRVYGGEVTIPPGQAVLVAAPLAGSLQAPPDGLPLAGRPVNKGQALFRLLPLLTPEGQANLAAARIEAEGQVKTAQTQVAAARVTLDRATKVFQSEAGSRRAVDDAQAQFDLAQKSLEAAASRRDLLDRVVGEVEKGTAAPLTIDSPMEGTLRNVSAQPGQNVPAGGALFEVADLRRLWVRVPVYVGDLPDVDTGADASVGELTMQPGQTQRPAKPAVAPPSASAAAGTVDLYYELDNPDGRYSPGQRVGVRLALRSEAESLTVPWSAVIYDIHGGTWVYEQTGERAFVRRRVDVRHVVGDTAVLAAGPTVGNRVVAAAPAVGTRVVVAGAAELFGTETGFTK
jgi:RND family efflux transporter MFP subunit